MCTGKVDVVLLDYPIAEGVTNGRMALETLRQSQVDVILMDVHMPEMDGIEATLELRRTEAGSSKPLNPNDLFARLARVEKGTLSTPV